MKEVKCILKIIKPYYTIETPIDGDAIVKHIEKCGRTCYKSEDKITKDSALKFVTMLIKNGHESVIEHFSLTIRFVCDRGVSHELVRHRLASFSQESTRYCNYGKADEITVIKPLFFEEGTPEYEIWKHACEISEESYLSLMDSGRTPQEARSVLPNSLKTEIVMTANLREWRTILKQRVAFAAHPQMRELTVLLLEELKEILPAIFDDITC